MNVSQDFALLMALVCSAYRTASVIPMGHVFLASRGIFLIQIHTAQLVNVLVVNAWMEFALLV
jgi:hypothetical protein